METTTNYEAPFQINYDIEIDDHNKASVHNIAVSLYGSPLKFEQEQAFIRDYTLGDIEALCLHDALEQKNNEEGQ
jgi:mevalonate kinase